MVGLNDMLKKEGRTRIWLRDRLKVTYPTLTNWEKGNTEPRASQIALICDLLKCEKEELFSNK